MNFKRVKGGSQSYRDALIRHFIDEHTEGELDLESGLPHMFHQLWNKMAETELWIEENEIDMKSLIKKVKS